MIKGFSRRKIKSEKTLGEFLKQGRLVKGVSISEAETGSKVRANFLTSLEEGDWSGLPATVYVRGFVLAYAKYLDLNMTEITELFESEAIFRRHIEKNTTLSYKKTFSDVKVLITPKVIGYSFLSVFVVGLITYLVFQVTSFAGNPGLHIFSPNDNAVVDSEMLNVAGLTDTDTVLSVNGETIPVMNDGRFSTNLKLHQGVNVVKVKATNKVKKESVDVLTVEYKPKTALLDTYRNQ